MFFSVHSRYAAPINILFLPNSQYKLDFDSNDFSLPSCACASFFGSLLYSIAKKTQTKHFVVPQVVDKKNVTCKYIWPKNYPAEAMIDWFCGISEREKRKKVTYTQPEGKLQRYEIRSTNQLEGNR